VAATGPAATINAAAGKHIFKLQRPFLPPVLRPFFKKSRKRLFFLLHFCGRQKQLAQNGWQKNEKFIKKPVTFDFLMRLKAKTQLRDIITEKFQKKTKMFFISVG